MNVPSGLTAQPRTLPVWPRRTRTCAQLTGSQSRSVPSLPADTMYRLSGLTAHASTEPS